MSLHPQQERLKKKLATREEEWQQRHEKLDRLRQARVIETDTATQFKLEQQIKDEEAELHTVEQNIDQLQHEIQQIERESEIQLPLSPALSSDFCLQRASTPTDVFNPQNSEKVGAQGFHPISSDWETIDFQPYLASLIADETYQRQWGSYTSTDAIGQVQVSPSATVLDVGLMVRLMQSEQPDDVRNPEHQKQTISERLPVLQGIRKYAPDHVLLMGRPGSGKTTTLLRLLVEEAKQAQADAAVKIPVLVELRYLDAECPSVLERIQTFLSRHTLQLEEAALKTALARGRFLLLLDGVNELPSEAAQRSLNRFRQDYAKTPMVFATRDIALGGDLGIAKKLEMQPLSEAQMRQFVQVYLPAQGESMVRQLQGRLREIGQTPLLLWMLCEVFKGLNQLPSNLGLLFRWFAGEYNKLKRDVPVAAGLHRWQDEILQQLAFTLMQAEEPTEFRVAMPRSQAETILTAFLTNKVDYPAQRAKAWLEDLLEHHLLQLTNQNQLEFHHQLLQEYYAAEALLRHLPHLSNEQLQQDYLNYLKWTEPLALMLSLIEHKEQALRVVKLALDVDWVLGARLAGQVRRDLQPETVNLIDCRAIPLKFKIHLLGCTRSGIAMPLLEKLLESDDDFIRRESLRAIGKIISTFSRVSLKQALDHQEAEIRWMAAYQLANFGDEAVMPVLQGALYNKEYHDNAILAIEKIDCTKVMPLLEKTINCDNPEIRLKATTSLHLRLDKGYEGILPLLEIALHDEDSQVRCSAAHALMDAGCEDALSILSQAWSDEDMLVRSVICTAFKQNQYPEIYLENSLKAALAGEDSTLRKRAIEVINKVKLDSENIIKALLKVVFSDPDFLIRGDATRALIIIGNSSVIHCLAKTLEEDDFETEEFSSSHSAAVIILMQIGSRDSVPILIKVLRDEDKTLVARIFAIQALGEIGDLSVVPILFEIRDNLDMDEEEYAYETEVIYSETLFALGKLGVQNLEDKIIDRMQTSTAPDTRQKAVETLGKIPTEKAQLGLLQALKDPNLSVRCSAALILAEQKHIDSIPILIEALGSRDSIGFEDSVACNSAINALGKIGEAVLPALEEALNHPDLQIQCNSKIAVDKIHNQDAEKYENNYPDSHINQLAGKYNFAQLLEALISADSGDIWLFYSALGQISQKEHIKLLYQSILEADSNNVFKYVPNLIVEIQQNAKVYNYILSQQIEPQCIDNSFPTNADLLSKIDQTTRRIEQHTQQMANEPKHDFSGATFQAPVNFGDSPAGDFIGTQNNYGTDPDLQGAMSDLQTLLHQLQTQHPHIATEPEALAIIEAEFTELKQVNSNKLSTLRQHLLNPERHRHAAKAALGEVVKHYREKNIWTKTLLTYFDTLSEERDAESK